MKLIYTILFFIISGTANATNYYISNTGSDAANGTSTGTSWQTIAKVNASSFVAGDSILFKAGDSWNEKLVVPSSGASGNHIIFSSYGTGVKPVITGFATLSGLTNSGNIWTANATNSVKKQNTVLVNGAIRGKGRYPNSTFLLTNNSSSGTTIQTALTGTPSYVGGEIAIANTGWVIDVSRITAQATGILTIYPGLNYTAPGNNRYCIMNLESVLDVQNEWCYDSASKVLKVYSTTSPTVQYSSIDTLVYINNKNHITFDGMKFTGANMAGICFDTTTKIFVKNCTIENMGRDGILPSNSTYYLVQNDSIVNSLSNAIYCFYRSNNSKIENNYIKNAGSIFGMGGSGDLTGMGMHAYGNSDTVINNRLDSIGYNGIYHSGTNSIIKYNYITNFCIIKSDGSAIYSYGGVTAGSLVRSNIMVNGLGGDNVAPGIYNDANASDEYIDSNTVINAFRAGLYQADAAVNLTYRNNTVVQIGVGNGMNISARGGTIIKNNIFYVSDSTWFCFHIASVNLNQGNSFDSNYYLRPLKEDKKFTYINSQTQNQYSLAGWRTLWTAYSWDVNSQSAPDGINTASPLILINPTLADSTISLNGIYMDARGVIYTNTCTVAPFQSKLLFQIAYRAKRRIKNLNFQ